MTRLGPKAYDCLKLADLHGRWDHEWDEHYAEICKRYSEKAVTVKLTELANRGYIEYGVSARTGWLTDKGREALAECERKIALVVSLFESAFAEKAP